MEQYLVTVWPEVKSKPKKRKFRNRKQKEIVIEIEVQPDEWYYCPYYDEVNIRRGRNWYVISREDLLG